MPFLLASVLIGVAMFFAIFGVFGAAGSFAGLPGKGNSDDTSGSISGDCDYQKILSKASAGKGEGEAYIKGKLASKDTKRPPAKFLSVYETTAEKHKLGGCGPSILAAIHSIETSFAPTGYAVVNSYGAGGPWQFLQSSWGFADSCHERGSKSWPAYSVENGACAAANHLKGKGKAPKNWYEGIYSYNHADWYVYAVAGLAREYAEGGNS